MKYVVKRDGRKVPFNSKKIENAIYKAFEEVDGVVTDFGIEKAHNISEFIKNKAYSIDKELTIEEIQDLVENGLMSTKRKDVARAYITYRNERSTIRDKKSGMIKKVMVKVEAENVLNSNANVDENTFSGREKEASAEIGKSIALDFGGLPEDVSLAHKTMLIYQHDLEKAAYGEHNCLNLWFQKIFTNGFVTRNGDVRPPRSLSTACQQYAVAFQCQSQVQFG